MKLSDYASGNVIFGNSSNFNFVHSYKTIGENILDVILKYGANGITHTQISKKLGYCTPIIRKTSAKIINKIGHKKYIERQRINNTFYYKSISNFNPEEAYKDIINSKYCKETLNNIGLKDSIYKLPYNYEIFPNIMYRLKKSKSEGRTVCELAIELGVNHTRGKKSISGELKRCLGKDCRIKFIEKIVNEETKETRYKLIYKYMKFTIEDLKKLAKCAWLVEEDVGEINKTTTQALNNVNNIEI